VITYECWNIGDKRGINDTIKNSFKPIIPTYHYSNIELIFPYKNGIILSLTKIVKFIYDNHISFRPKKEPEGLKILYFVVENKEKWQRVKKRKEFFLDILMS
jgi:hypothetical protein